MPAIRASSSFTYSRRDGQNSPSTASFNSILMGLARRQLDLDFPLGAAASLYEPQRSIGAGAFGIVCEARQTLYDGRLQPVAIKKIGHASATPTLARRTLREVRVLRYIAHSNIVALKDAFRTEGRLGMNVFLVMELMEGSLHHVIHGPTQPALDYGLIAHLLFQILRGLRFLHTAGIAHRDLKPSNLLVNSNADLKIADFVYGHPSAPPIDDSAEEHSFYLTQHIATLPYRAPELLFSLPEHATEVDMWAVGCILAEMVMRRELFPGRSVGQQIKYIVLSLGTPPTAMMAEIGCEKTRNYIETIGYRTPLPWEEIVKFGGGLSRSGGSGSGSTAGSGEEDEVEILDLLEKLMRMDPRGRIDVHDAIYHAFLRPYIPVIPVERGCPFKVKMDMAAVEYLSHAQLVRLIGSDVRSADPPPPIMSVEEDEESQEKMSPALSTEDDALSECVVNEDSSASSEQPLTNHRPSDDDSAANVDVAEESEASDEGDEIVKEEKHQLADQQGSQKSCLVIRVSIDDAPASTTSSVDTRYSTHTSSSSNAPLATEDGSLTGGSSASSASVVASTMGSTAAPSTTTSPLPPPPKRRPLSPPTYQAYMASREAARPTKYYNYRSFYHHPQNRGTYDHYKRIAERYSPAVSPVYSGMGGVARAQSFNVNALSVRPGSIVGSRNGRMNKHQNDQEEPDIQITAL